MENSQIAAVFAEIADMLEILGVPDNAFRIRSYRNAARTIDELPDRLADLVATGKDPADLPGIGTSLAEKIQEVLRNGTCAKLKELRRQLPGHLPELLQVKGIGPQTCKRLHDKLGIASLDELKQAAERGKLVAVLGEKTQQNILKGLATLVAVSGRISIEKAAVAVAALGRHLQTIATIRRWEAAGSCRRRCETIGDLDILVEASDRAAAAKGILRYGPIERVLARGEEKVSVVLAGGLQVDFRFIEPDAYGAALLYFTGSKAHNIVLRKRAQAAGLKLSEYGLFKGEQLVASRSEADLYKALALPWIPPELREDRGEVEVAAAGPLPALIERKDLRGDLHVHTNATDGTDTIEQMVAAAQERGYEYLAITDHSKAVTVAHGLDEQALRLHVAQLRKVGAGLKRFWLLAGVEVDILRDGRLDIDPALLTELDWVVGSIHSVFELPGDKMTERLLRAVESGVIDCIGHPFSRLLGQRDPLRFDVDRVFKACAQAGVCLEINAQPDRLDLPDVYCKRAREMGVTLVISSDAHKAAGLDCIEFGVGVARRGWLESKDVLNTRSAAELKSFKAEKSSRRAVRAERPPRASRRKPHD